MAVVSFIVVGLATGGTGWVALSIVAGVGALASWRFSEGAESGAGYIYDKASNRK